MKVLITGASGQLGHSLLRAAPSGNELHALTRAELDVSDAAAVRKVVQEFRPEVIVNAAAYTAVDKAETETDRAFAVNAYGPEYLAKAAQQSSARLIHISTDFVFDGLKSRPYRPEDAVNPLGAYGRSKAEGDKRVRAVLGNDAVIVRTGWVYAAEGHNFVNTILRLAREKDSLAVIADQVGTPTWARSLARLVWALVQRSEVKGIFHWSDAGVASWYDFAVAIQEEGVATGLLKKTIPIRPITTEEYPLPARRPAYSVLEKQATVALTGVKPDHWRVNLRAMLKELFNA